MSGNFPGAMTPGNALGGGLTQTDPATGQPQGADLTIIDPATGLPRGYVPGQGFVQRPAPDQLSLPGYNEEMFARGETSNIPNLYGGMTPGDALGGGLAQQQPQPYPNLMQNPAFNPAAGQPQPQPQTPPTTAQQIASPAPGVSQLIGQLSLQPTRTPMSQLPQMAAPQIQPPQPVQQAPIQMPIDTMPNIMDEYFKSGMNPALDPFRETPGPGPGPGPQPQPVPDFMKPGFQTGRPDNADVFGNLPGSPGYKPFVTIRGGPAIQTLPQPYQPSDLSLPGPTPRMGFGEDFNYPQPAPAPAPQPAPSPMAQPQPRMPTQATQGYQSRIQPRPAPRAAARPAPAPAPKPVARPNPFKPVTKAAAKPVRR